MQAYDTVREAAKIANISLASIGRDIGKPSNYVNNGMSRGSVPQADTLAAMLAPCGYALAAVPLDSLPPDALVIDPKRD